jgi:ABC-type iron transport system FetAB permease component
VNVNLMPYFVLWVALGAVVIGMIIWRKTVSSHEDEALHVLDAGALNQQVSVGHKLETIDKWGKILTAIAVIFGLILGAIYMYQSWVAMSKIGV